MNCRIPYIFRRGALLIEMNSKKLRAVGRTATATALIVLVAAVGLGYLWLSSGGTAGNSFQGTIQGAGATFPYPFYSNLSQQYLKVAPGVQINYNSIGSGGGIRQFTDKTVDFGASDAPLTDSQFASAAGVVHVPMVIGGVVAAYNVPGLSNGLRLTGDVLAKIFLGNITRWNDSEIRALNPTVTLPANPIIVVHRSDGSGTTFVWTQYLASVSQTWADAVGVSTSVNWPIGLGGNGNNGVAGLIVQNPYSIGYVEYTYAILNGMNYAAIRNAAGNFILPDVQSISKAAAAAALSLPRGDQSWSQVSIIKAVVNDTQAADAYPVTSFTYVLVYKDLSVVPGMTLEKAKAMIQFLWWAVHDGQSYAQPLAYVPLPPPVVSLDETTLRSIQFNGQAVMP